MEANQLQWECVCISRKEYRDFMGKSLQGKELGSNISQRKDGRYQGSFVNRFGKRQYIYDTKLSELKKRLRAAQVSNDNATNIIPSDITVDEWFHTWMNIYKSGCRNTTKMNYQVDYNRVKDNLGSIKLSDLKLVQIQNAINSLKTTGTKTASLKILRSMLEKAVDSELIAKNPAAKVVVLQKKECKPIRFMTKQETALLLEEVKDSVRYPLIVVTLGTGMRIGEVVGLTWDDIDFKNNIIHVRKTLCIVKGEAGLYFEFHEPKTEKGRRDIPMLPDVKTALKNQYTIKQDILKRGNKPQVGFENLVFTTDTNGPVNTSCVRKILKQASDRINKKNPELNFEDIHPHALRHTFATRCIESGMAPKTLQILLGHSNIKLTMDLYCHVTQETIDLEMGKLKDFQIAL